MMMIMRYTSFESPCQDETNGGLIIKMVFLSNVSNGGLIIKIVFLSILID